MAVSGADGKQLGGMFSCKRLAEKRSASFAFTADDSLHRGGAFLRWTEMSSARLDGFNGDPLIIGAPFNHQLSMRTLIHTLFFLGIIICQPLAHASDAIERAQTFFDSYVRAAHAFDASIPDFYADDALIQNRRIYPTGHERLATLSGQQYKALIRSSMWLAKLKGDIDQFRDPVFTTEGPAVRVTMTRYSELKKYSSPFQWLVGPDKKSGKWMILEEISESRP